MYDRRRGLYGTSVVLCGAYAVSCYVNERLEEVKEKVVRGRAAREAYVRRLCQRLLIYLLIHCY